MSNASHPLPISVQDYLAGELIARRKHEFVDGVVYAMSGGTVTHSRIASNAVIAVGSQLRGKKCEVFNSDMKVRVRQSRGTRFYYPDLSVVCQPNPPTDTFQDAPVVIVEVLSESTRRVDQYEKREAYLSIDSLRVLILVEQSLPAATVYRRHDEGFDREVFNGLDATIPLPEINCQLPLTELFANVEFVPIANEDDE